MINPVVLLCIGRVAHSAAEDCYGGSGRYPRNSSVVALFLNSLTKWRADEASAGTSLFTEVLRRLMHDRLDQKVREVAQRPTERRVEPLPARVGCHLCGQAGEQTAQRLRPVALQREKVLQL
jgi:hypothetical protein